VISVNVLVKSIKRYELVLVLVYTNLVAPPARQRQSLPGPVLVCLCVYVYMYKC